MIGLLSNGRSDFNDVDLYRGDGVFANAYGIERLPSEAVLRQRLDELPPLRSHAALRDLNTRLLGKVRLPPRTKIIPFASDQIGVLILSHGFR
jgi:hypothetical protein